MNATMQAEAPLKRCLTVVFPPQRRASRVAGRFHAMRQARALERLPDLVPVGVERAELEETRKAVAA